MLQVIFSPKQINNTLLLNFLIMKDIINDLEIGISLYD